MCGIFGIVAAEDGALGEILLAAGRRLTYRGYDSIGCAVITSSGSIDLRKDVGKIDDVNGRLHFTNMQGRRGIVQLRWATFGSPSHDNAQPHLDSDGDLVGAHNGNIVNNVALREAFIAEGMTVRGTNDGESCVHAVERYVDRGFDMVEAIRRAARDLQGDYAFVIGRVDGKDGAAGAPLYAIKQGSGLVVGFADGATCVSSDLPSILPLTNRILRVYDGEMVILWPDRAEIRRVDDGAVVDREAEIATESMDAVRKGGYAHFMLKEIHEQPKVAADLLHWLGASPFVEPFLEELRRARHLYLVGCGTSYHACLIGAAYFNRLAGIPAVACLAPQFRETLARTLSPGDAVVLVSQSGETKDVLNALNAARGTGARLLGVLNVIGSTLMHAAHRYLPIASGYEISVPATKTFLNQVILFLYLADRLHPEGPRIAWREVPELIQRALDETDASAKRIAEILEPLNELYYLGYGLTLGVALEGALKLKEITYAHCEGILSAEFKHGPLSSVYDGYPVVFITAPEDVAMMVSHVNETTCRGGRAIAIAAEDKLLRENVHDYLVLPAADPEVTTLLAAIPLQLVSYYMSLARGIDPDFPRNLSKTLTVD
jgi:glucosamine--fructose-6-phosphate aminotransferase (isomerizing)